MGVRSWQHGIIRQVGQSNQIEPTWPLARGLRVCLGWHRIDHVRPHGYNGRCAFFRCHEIPGVEETMADTEREPQSNPLDDVAAAASDSLKGQTVSVNGSAARRIDAGQVKMQGSSAGSIHAHAVSLENSAAGIASAGSLET